MSGKDKPLTWKTRRIKLKDLIEWDKNPVQISERDAKELAKSVSKFDHVIPYVAAAPPNGSKALPLLDGHQRKMVELQINKVSPDTMVDVRVPSRKLTEKERKEIVIRLRKNTGEFDFDILANNFDVPDLLEWGFDEKELLGAGFEFGDTSQDAPAQIDRAAELQKKWKVKTGDLFAIGNHRLLCGDSTLADDIDYLLDKKKPVMSFIDPPYNALKSWNKDEAKGETRLDPSKWFENDNMEWDEYWDFMSLTFSLLRGHSVYVCCDYRIFDGLKPLLEAVGYNIKHLIVWKKNVWGLGKRFRFQHEFIIYACKDKAPFYGGHDKSDVWEVDAVRGSDVDHNTPKPIELPKRAMECSSKKGEFIFDGFCGSGTSIVAGQNMGRNIFAIEKSPSRVAVSLQRMTDAFSDIKIERIK